VNDLYGLFASTAARFPERIAVEVQRSGSLDTFRYAELNRMALAVASSLAARGVTQGDRVAILAENDAHWCATFLGVLRLGAVAVPLDTAYKPAQIEKLLADCGAKVLLRSPLREITSGEPGALPEASIAPRDPAVILYTSGTTSDPKGVVLTQGNFLAEREAAFAIVNVVETDGILSVLPLFHALALLANLILPLSVGARVVFLESVNTTELMRALRERDISVFCCVPQFFYLIRDRVLGEVRKSGALKRLVFRTLLAGNGALRHGLGVNLGTVFFRPVHAALGPRMRILVTGGSRFDPTVGRDLVRLGFDIRQAYGLTECCGGATVTRPGDLDLDHVGNPLPGVEIQSLEGEICIRGPIVMQGYYHRDDANAATLKDGWLRTGDLGFIDAKGRVHVTGRSKDVIVLASGKNIYPEEIEAHYAQSPFIKELIVLGRARPGDPAAERLHAVVVPDQDVMRERKIVNMREQIRFEIEGLSVDLPSHKRILSYDIRLEDLPRTTTRKLKRFQVEKELLAAGETTEVAATAQDPADAAWLEDPFVARAVGLIKDAAKGEAPVHAKANLELDLGLDSMERVELLVRLEQATGVKVEDEVSHRIYTVRDLVEALRSAPASGGSGAQAWEQLLADVPPEDPAIAGLLRSRPVATLLLFALARLFRLAARVTVGLRVSGLDRLPSSGPFILSPNHQSYLDAFLLCACLPYRHFKRMFFVGASEYFTTTLMLRIARAIHVVPVDPDTNLVRAMQAGAFGLRNDKVLILFPEGERSIDGEVKTFKKGAAILSRHLDVPIVPVAIDGIFDVWPRNRPFRWRALLPGSGSRVLLAIGDPLPPEASAGDAALTDRLRGAVERMWMDLRARRSTA
jgi:long-chain acyl-CoA synthetase